MNNLSYELFLNNLKSKRVMVFGLARSNEHIIKKFHQHGAYIIACDSKKEENLPVDIKTYLKENNIECRLGSQSLSKLDCDILIRTPGMNFFSDIIVRARKLGIVVTSEMELFFDFCPCRIIGITGSDGKSTVTTIIYEMLKRNGYNVFKGGNIGYPLLPVIDKMKHDDIVVAELSSFQLISMRKSPDIAVITNISPNHLDVHKDMNEYVSAKKNIIMHQNAFSTSVLNFDNYFTKEMQNDVRGKTIFFSKSQKLDNGVWINDSGDIIFSENGNDSFVINKNSIKLPGIHNLENYLTAISCVHNLVDINSIKQTAETFEGINHRMEKVKTIKNITFYNDSIATSPTRVISGCLSIFDRKIILIAGGYDKNIPFDELGDTINKKVKVLVLLGQTSDKIEKAVLNSKFHKNESLKILKTQNMAQAVKEAYNNSKDGDIIALSPACASFGMYKNFEERGLDFKNIVNSLEVN